MGGGIGCSKLECPQSIPLAWPRSPKRATASTNAAPVVTQVPAQPHGKTSSALRNDLLMMIESSTETSRSSDLLDPLDLI